MWKGCCKGPWVAVGGERTPEVTAGMMEDRAKSCLIRVWNRDTCGVEEKSKIDNGEKEKELKKLS